MSTTSRHIGALCMAQQGNASPPPPPPPRQPADGTVSWAFADRLRLGAPTAVAAAAPATAAAPVAPAAPMTTTAPAAATAADDWALLFGAVCERLQASASAAPPGDALAQVVLDSVHALRNLQRMPVAPDMPVAPVAARPHP